MHVPHDEPTFFEPETPPPALRHPDVVIAVCTRKRPEMLARCLASLEPQGAQIVVVDNDDENHALDVPNNVMVVYEPRRGIAYARNAAMKAASFLGAKWIAFIDDDETADEHWLDHLMAPEYLDTPILSGFHWHKFPDAPPFFMGSWVTFPNPKHEGRSLKRTVTANVRISMDVYNAGFRFDTKIGYMGGEDIDFTGRACRNGFAIKQTIKAITYEEAHPERHTVRGMLYRHIWCTVSDLYADAKLNGWAVVTIKELPKAAFYVMVGAVVLPLSPLSVAFGVERFKATVRYGLKRLGKGIGRLVWLSGYKPSPYAVVVGK